MAEHKPLYRKTREMARMLGEIPQWRESWRENVACAKAIDKAIAEGYDGMHLQEGIAGELTEQFGLDRVAWVLANTLHALCFAIFSACVVLSPNISKSGCSAIAFIRSNTLISLNAMNLQSSNPTQIINDNLKK